MNLRLRSPALASIAVVSGAIVLLGYFIHIPLLTNLRSIFLNWSIILIAITLVVGVWNLLQVHIKKYQSGVKESIYSIVLIISLILSFFVVVFFGLTSGVSLWIFNYLLVPVEASLLAILAIVFIYAIARIFCRSFSIINLLFALTALFFLSATAIVSWIQLPFLIEARDWISQVWALAGARAILLGVALGAIATGLRVLMGVDRPYEG